MKTKFKIRNYLKDNDLLFNVEATYPKFILDLKYNNVYDENLFYTYL